MAADKTLAIWLPGDMIPAENVATLTAYLAIINNRQAIVFDDNDPRYAHFQDILPSHYSGGKIGVNMYITSEDDVIGGKVIEFFGALQRHNEGDLIDTDSYGTEISRTGVPSTTNYTCQIIESLEFDTAAKRDSLAAGELFTLRIRRNPGIGLDTFADVTYVLAVHMFEEYI